MKIMFQLFICYICSISIASCALDDYTEPGQSVAMISFAQDSIVQHAVKQERKQSRRVRFKNNIQEIATGVLKAYDSLALVEPVCIINGKILQANDECDLDIENDRCLVSIGLRPGFAQTIKGLEESFWGHCLRYIEKYLLRSRSLTFICYLPNCNIVDTATLFFNACAQSETEYNVRMRSPLDLEISLPTPVEY